MEVVLVEGGEWVGGMVTGVDGDTVKVTSQELSVTLSSIFFFRSLSGSLSATGGSSLLVETFRGIVMRWCYLEITH